MKKLLRIMLLIVSFSLEISAKTHLMLDRGTMHAGGSITMPIYIPKDGSTAVGLQISPEIGYFPLRSFSLSFLPSVEKTFLANEASPWRFSVAARGTYYFDFGGPIYPYVGAGVGIRWQTKTEGMEFPLTLPIGMLVAINNHVAVNFGVPILVAFNKDGFQGLSLPIGYLGIRAFF